MILLSLKWKNILSLKISQAGMNKMSYNKFGAAVTPPPTPKICNPQTIIHHGIPQKQTMEVKENGVIVSKYTEKDISKTTVKKSLITPGFFRKYLPFIVFIAIALLLLISIIFIPAKTITKLFAASTAIAWTSLWATITYLVCLGGNTFIAWFIAALALFLWAVITVMVFIGAINLDSSSNVPVA